MSPQDLLPTFAELAIALLGFSGIVSVFQATGTGWIPDGRFWAMLRCGLASLAYSLLPLPLLAAGLPKATVWAITSLAFAAFGLAYVGNALRQAPRSDTTGTFNFSLFAVFMTASTLVSALLVYNVFGPRAFWPYLAALAWFTLHPALLLVRLLRLWLSGSRAK